MPLTASRAEAGLSLSFTPLLPPQTSIMDSQHASHRHGDSTASRGGRQTKGKQPYKVLIVVHGAGRAV